jgi:hypothetical protein
MQFREAPVTWIGKGLSGFLLMIAAHSAVMHQLPLAPSAVQQERQKPKAPPEVPAAAPSQPPAAPSTGEPANNGSEPARPTSESSEPDESVATFRARVDEVNLVFAVTDKRGRFIKGLGQDDFKILDDNKPPQAVVSFRGETDLPLRLGLLIDASNSVRDRFRFEQEAAVQFLSQNIRYRYDQAFVLGFDSNYEVTQDFTDDTEKLTKCSPSPSRRRDFPIRRVLLRGPRQASKKPGEQASAACDRPAQRWRGQPKSCEP